MKSQPKKIEIFFKAKNALGQHCSSQTALVRILYNYYI